MALTPELEALKIKIEATDATKRTSSQAKLLQELRVMDKLVLQKSIEESTAGLTRMTSPGSGTCSCCGR